MEHDKPVYSGYLLMPPVGKILIKKSWQQKFCLLFKASKFGIERLEIYDNDQSLASQSRIITLENCIKIIPRSPTYFAVTTKLAEHEFGALSTKAMSEWLAALQSVAFRDDSSKTTTFEEDNDLYCSSGEGIFNVRLHPSQASVNCGLESKLYTLVLTSSAIQIRECHNNKILFTWPYCFIRRYGYKSGKFTFEAGRKCESGEGVFYLEHSNQQEIFRCLASKMKSMKKLLHPDSITTMFECGDNQLHAALSMEARSRSPLPPSPTTSTSLQDVMDTNITSKSQAMLLEGGVDHILINKNRSKPLKPPRKTLAIRENNNVNIPPDYEPIDKYDKVEYRNEAWRTLGLDDVDHTEVKPEVGDELPQSHKRNITMGAKAGPKIITQFSSCSNLDEDYDKLEFFGSCSKLDSPSGYKQINIGSTDCVFAPTFNDYDEVEPLIESARLADDSHLGYAVIRRAAPSPREDVVNHKFYNEEAYAVISKPKRV